MRDNRLLRMIRRKSIIRATFGIPPLLLCAVTVCFMIPSMLFSVEGFITPKAVTTTGQLDGIVNTPMKGASYRVSVTVQAGDLADAAVKVTEDGKTVGRYVAAYMGDQYVLCLVSPERYDGLGEDREYTFTGTLTLLDSEAELLVKNNMHEQGIPWNEANELLYRYSIDTQDSGVPLRLAMYFAILSLGFFGIFLPARGIRSAVNVYAYPQVKELVEYGQPDILLQDINGLLDAAGPECTFPMKKGGCVVYFLQRWLVIESPANVEFIKAGTLLRAYHEKVSFNVYRVMKTGVRHYARLRTAKRTFSVLGSEATVETLLEIILKKYPWVIGYSRETEHYRSANPLRIANDAEAKKAEMQWEG